MINLYFMLVRYCCFQGTWSLTHTCLVLSLPFGSVQQMKFLPLSVLQFKWLTCEWLSAPVKYYYFNVSPVWLFIIPFFVCEQVSCRVSAKYKDPGSKWSTPKDVKKPFFAGIEVICLFNDLRKIVVGGSDWRFDNLSGSHQSQLNSCCQLLAERFKWRTSVVIGQFRSVGKVGRSFHFVWEVKVVNKSIVWCPQ